MGNERLGGATGIISNTGVFYRIPTPSFARTILRGTESWSFTKIPISAANADFLENGLLESNGYPGLNFVSSLFKLKQ